MESAQEADWSFCASSSPPRVSILVVMESAQEEWKRLIGSNRAQGFNPCCNGKCSGSDERGKFKSLALAVSILVVMESAQEVRCPGRWHSETAVSILVVMESAQEAERVPLAAEKKNSFNPCCNGKCSGRDVPKSDIIELYGFNPCCNGKCSGRAPPGHRDGAAGRFQSLL